MKRSMIQRRQDAERERIQRCEAALRRTSLPARAAPDFDRALDDAMRGHAGETVREAHAWRARMKSRDAGRLRPATCSPSTR